MKKVMLFVLLFLGLFSVQGFATHAEEYTYPFDSIRIVSAFTFDVLVEDEPNVESALYGNVHAGETLTIYVGNLEFVFEGVVVQGSGSIIILTNESDEDFVAWLLNSYSSDLTNSQSASFASWITIDPEVGVHKDLSGINIEVGYTEDLITHDFVFFDNLNNEYPMVAGTYVEEDTLDILISAYTEGE